MSILKYHNRVELTLSLKNFYGSQAIRDGQLPLKENIRVGSTPTASTNFKQEEAVKVSMDITRC